MIFRKLFNLFRKRPKDYMLNHKIGNLQNDMIMIKLQLNRIEKFLVDLNEKIEKWQTQR